jgi:carboxyl-terminal processing protease
MKCVVVILAAVGLLVTNCFSQKTQSNRNYSAEAQLLKKTIQANHFRPRAIDDTFSEWVYWSFLEELDPDRIFFTQEDFNSIIAYKFKIDDDINLNRWTFLPAVSGVYERSLKRADKISTDLLLSPFTFTKAEMYEPDTTWAKNDVELKERWRKSLKHEILSRLIEIRRGANEGDDAKFLARYEVEARQRVKAGHRISGDNRSCLRSTFELSAAHQD